MVSKLIAHKFIYLSLAALVLLSCAVFPPRAAEDIIQPDTSTPAPPPTQTSIPPTNTTLPPTLTATPLPVSINTINIPAITIRQEFMIAGDSVRSVAISPNSQLLAAGTGSNLSSPDQKLRIWELKTGLLIAESEKLNTIIWDTAFTPDGKLLAVALDYPVLQIRTADDLSLVDTIDQPGAVNSLAISPDGKWIATGVAEADSPDGNVYIWDFESHQLRIEFWAHPYSVPSMDFSPNGSLLATGAIDRAVKVWDSQTGALLQTLPQSGQGTAVKFSPDGSLLATGFCSESINLVCQKGSAYLWNTSTWQISKTLTGPTDWVESVAFSPDSEILIGASRNGLIYLWRVSDGVLLRTLAGHKAGVETIAFSSDGSQIASGSSDSVILWGIAP